MTRQLSRTYIQYYMSEFSGMAEVYSVDLPPLWWLSLVSLKLGSKSYNFKLGLPLSPIADSRYYFIRCCALLAKSHISRNVPKRVSLEVFEQQNGSRVNVYRISKFSQTSCSELLPQSECSTNIYRYLLPSLSILLYSSRPSKAFGIQIGVTLRIQYVHFI